LRVARLGRELQGARADSAVTNPAGGTGHIFEANFRIGTVQNKSISAFRFPLAVLAVNPILSGHPISLDFSAERQDVASSGAEYDVMRVDGAFNSAGLVRALEMPRELIAILFDFDVFRGAPAIVYVLRVNRPISRNVVGRLFRWRFLRHGGAGENDEKQEQRKYQRLRIMIFHGIIHGPNRPEISRTFLYLSSGAQINKKPKNGKRLSAYSLAEP
jgi:hypothetical protein